MSFVPKGWSVKTFGEVLSLITNGINGKQNKEGNGIPVSRIETIADQRVDLSRVGFLAEYDEGKIDKYRLEEGDILFSHINSPIHLGKTALVSADIVLYHGANLLRLKCEKSVDPRFFNYYCKYLRALGEFSKNAQHAVNQSSINQKKLKAFELVAPSLEEQKRIADKLDSVLAKVEAAQARLDKIPAILKRFRQSVLAAATSGELTKEWREKRNHSTEDMLSGFEELAAPPRYASRNKGFIFGINATSVGTPSTAAVRQWKWVPLVKVAQMSSGHTPSRSKPEYWGGSINWLGIKDAREHHSKEINSTIQKTNELGVSNSATRILPKGTICISRTASVGYVVKLGADMCTSQDFVNWTCSEVVDADWLKWLFVAEKEALFKFGKGTTHTTVYFPEWLSINILLPPIEEQQEIVRIIDGLFCKADRIERQFNDTKLRINKLTQSVLAKAFKGELLTSSVDSDIESIENSIEALNA